MFLEKKINEKYILQKDSDLFFFIYFLQKNDWNSKNLIFNSSRIIFKIKYGLLHYFFWLKVGCRNIHWRSAFTVYFLLDFIIATKAWGLFSNFILFLVKYRCLRSKKLVYTLSKGPMVRKKQSREQYAFKQLSINVKKIVYFVKKDDYRSSSNLSSDKILNHRKLILFNKYFQLFRNLNNFSPLSIFIFFNYNVFFFFKWIMYYKRLRIFFENILFQSKVINTEIIVSDLQFFFI